MRMRVPHTQGAPPKRSKSETIRFFFVLTALIIISGGAGTSESSNRNPWLLCPRIDSGGALLEDVSELAGAAFGLIDHRIGAGFMAVRGGLDA